MTSASTISPPRAPQVWAWVVIVGLGLLHDWGVWLGLGGREQITGPWPLARHDHPLYFHYATITPRFLRLSGTTAGYDPSFMAGHAKSVVFPASSTLPELVMALGGRANPVLAYKLYVLVAVGLVPWLFVASGLLWRARPGGIAAGMLLDLIYVWTDFPIQYAGLGMVPYLLAIPWGLAATGFVVRYLERGGWAWWVAAALGTASLVLVHFTSVMVVAPACLTAYAVAWHGKRRAGNQFPRGRHVGLWMIPVVVLVLNAFWWTPGLWLVGTKGESGFAFTHSKEQVWWRLLKMVTVEPSAQAIILGLSVPGLPVLWRRDRVAAGGLVGLMAAGFGWGYLAGALPEIDFLQPGRHSFALFTAGALAAGVGLAEMLARLRGWGRGLSWLGTLGVLIVGVRVFAAEVVTTIRDQLDWRGADPARVARYGTGPFLSSQPPDRLVWLVERIRRHTAPGDRLLYEEGGIGPDPFEGGRYSGLLPSLTGVECLGGPFLRVALTTNFTQFGGGSLFGEAAWDRAHFERYARVYRPTAIVCWSPRARAFCRASSDLIEVLDDDGVLLVGRVKGFGGATVRGEARVRAEPGRLLVSGAVADVDGKVVLRYHSAPYLRSSPPVPLEEVYLAGDPVPFIAFRPNGGPLRLEMDLPP